MTQKPLIAGSTLSGGADETPHKALSNCIAGWNEFVNSSSFSMAMGTDAAAGLIAALERRGWQITRIEPA